MELCMKKAETISLILKQWLRSEGINDKSVASVQLGDLLVVQSPRTPESEEMTLVESALFQMFFSLVGEQQPDSLDNQDAAENALLIAQGLMAEAFFCYMSPPAPSNPEEEIVPPSASIH